MNKRKVLRNKKELLLDFFDNEIFYHSKVIKENPYVAEAYLYRGFAYEKKGNLKQAISDYSKAIKIKPDYTDAYFYRAVAYFCSKEFSKSWKDIHRVEELGGKPSPVFLRYLKTASRRER